MKFFYSLRTIRHASLSKIEFGGVQKQNGKLVFSKSGTCLVYPLRSAKTKCCERHKLTEMKCKR